MYPVIIGATIPAIFDTVFCIPPMVPTKLESGAISHGIAHMLGDAAIAIAKEKDNNATAR